MTAVLGIDAAWTPAAPSGVALVSDATGRWRCVAVAPSYAAFLALGGAASAPAAHGGVPDPPALLAAAQRLLGGVAVDVVAVDMPLATAPITGRRAADDAVSRGFGGRGCGTHTPSPTRPGAIERAITLGFGARGYQLATAPHTAGRTPALLEVYPHPAMMALLGASYRIPYKVSRARSYWPAASPAQRVENLLAQWRAILDALATHLGPVPLALPVEPRGAALKACEDTLDAVVCAWVGIAYCEGRARPFGDDSAAIWCP